MNRNYKVRKPIHPGVILEEHYIKPLELNLEELAENLGISRNTLFKIRKGQARVTPDIAVRLAKAFDTSADLWLNLQQKLDLWEVYNERSIIVLSIYSHRQSKETKKPKIAPFRKKTSVRKNNSAKNTLSN